MTIAGDPVSLLIKRKKQFPKAFIRGHNEIPGATPKPDPTSSPRKNYHIVVITPLISYLLQRYKISITLTNR